MSGGREGEDAADDGNVARVGRVLKESASEGRLERVLKDVLREQSTHTASIMLNHQQSMLDGMKQAVRDGIAAAAQDEKLATQFFSTAIATVRAQSKSAMGNWAWNKLTTWGRRGLWIVFILIVFLWVFGLAALQEASSTAWHILVEKGNRNGR